MSQVFRSCGQSIGASASVSSPSSEYSGLISFRTDWFDFLAVQATLKNLLQPLLKNISSSNDYSELISFRIDTPELESSMFSSHLPVHGAVHAMCTAGDSLCSTHSLEMSFSYSGLLEMLAALPFHF